MKLTLGQVVKFRGNMGVEFEIKTTFRTDGIILTSDDNTGIRETGEMREVLVIGVGEIGAFRGDRNGGFKVTTSRGDGGDGEFIDSNRLVEASRVLEACELTEFNSVEVKPVSG